MAGRRRYSSREEAIIRGQITHYTYLKRQRKERKLLKLINEKKFNSNEWIKKIYTKRRRTNNNNNKVDSSSE